MTTNLHHSKASKIRRESFMRVTCKISRQTGFLAVVVLSLLCTSLTSAAASYKVTILTSDQTGAPFLDSNLQNPWGLTYSPTGPFWVSDNNSGVSTIYMGTGAPNALVVTILPSVCCGSTKGSPTGVVFNGSAPDFQGAHFIFATEDGTISAWTGGITTAIAVDNSASLANYKGMELANNGSRNLLYVADFHNGKIDVFDTNFVLVTLGGGQFIDPNIQAVPAPFNFELINVHL